MKAVICPTNPVPHPNTQSCDIPNTRVWHAQYKSVPCDIPNTKVWVWHTHYKSLSVTCPIQRCHMPNMCINWPQGTVIRWVYKSLTWSVRKLHAKLQTLFECLEKLHPLLLVLKYFIFINWIIDLVLVLKLTDPHFRRARFHFQIQCDNIKYGPL